MAWPWHWWLSSSQLARSWARPGASSNQPSAAGLVAGRWAVRGAVGYPRYNRSRSRWAPSVPTCWRSRAIGTQRWRSVRHQMPDVKSVARAVGARLGMARWMASSAATGRLFGSGAGGRGLGRCAPTCRPWLLSLTEPIRSAPAQQSGQTPLPWRGRVVRRSRCHW